jgi:succinoglycan biosynthesis protein ExoM
MDDDLQLHPGWLDALVETMNTPGADAAVGPVSADFPAGAPSWDPDGARFTRILPHRSGDIIAVSGPEKPRNFAISTASSIWRAATCFTDPEPFDPSFGGVGGEDFDLFLRLERRGRRIVWCAEAGVRETIPDERTTFSNHLMRTYSGAQAYAAVTIKNADHAVPVAADVMARGALQAAACGLRMVPLAVKAGLGRQDAGLRLRHEVLAAASALGKVMWWRKLRYYHVEKASAAS